MERGIAEGGIVVLILMNDAREDRRGLFLATQTDGTAQARIVVYDRRGAGKSLRVNLAAGETPAVFMDANQRVDKVRAGTDIQHRGLCRYHAAAIRRQQICQMVNIVRAPRYGWAKIALRNIPLRDAVKMGQQRFI